jgi:hypothetical protein
VTLTEKAAKFFSGKSAKFNTEFLIARNLCAVKCNGEKCGFPIYGLEINFQSFHFYFLDMDGETLLKFNHGDIYKAEDLDEPKHWFVSTFLKTEVVQKQYEIFRLMNLL